MNWKYKNKQICDQKDLPNNVVGFVYKINYDDDTFYIGKKSTVSEKVVPIPKYILKDEEAMANITKVNRLVMRNSKGNIVTNPTEKRRLREQGIKAKTEQWMKQTKPSYWQKYEGSCKDSKGKKILSKEILEFAYSKIDLTYLETKYLFEYDVLNNYKSLNSNILGKFFCQLTKVE